MVNLVWLVVAVCWSLAVWHDASDYLELEFWEEVEWLYDYEEQLEALAELDPALVWFNVGFGVLFWVFLYLISGVQTYFAHRRGPTDTLDHRSVSLAYYACGPMLLLVLPAGLMLASGYVNEYVKDYGELSEFVGLTDAMFAFSWLLILFVAGLCLWTCARFAGLLSGAGLGRQFLTLALLPLAWLSLGLLVFAVVPGVLLLFYFVFATF